ncbi:MAG TPA: glycosyltransferase family 39 protein [bacterium]|nr:glycosyltransferase family 39 protein [bacterium]
MKHIINNNITDNIGSVYGDIYGKYKYEIYVAVLSVLVFIVHVHLASTLNFGNDEAHYYVWSLKQSLGYLDDAPLVSYIIYIFTGVFGKSELSVRLGAVVMSFFDGFLIYYLSQVLFKSKRASFFAFLFFLSALIFNSVLSVMILPDASLLFFYLCFLISFYKAVEYKKGSGFNLFWILSGLFLGLAFLSKYTAALIPVSVLLYLIFSKKHRGLLKTFYPYATLGIALLVFSPVIYWNFTHNFISFKFQLFHGFSHPNPGFPLFIDGWAGQFLVITPFIYIFLIGVFAYSLRLILGKKRRKFDSNSSFSANFQDIREGFLYSVSLSLPILLFFIANGYSHRTLVHWPDIGYLAAFPIMGYTADLLIKKKNFLLKYYVYFSIFFGFFLFFVLYNQIYYNSIPVGKIIKYIDKEKQLKKGGVFALIPHIPGKPKTANITNDLFGWKKSAKYLNMVYKGYKTKYGPLFILTHHYAIADELVYYGDYKPAVNIYNISDFLNQYDLWQNLNKINGENAIFIMDNKYMINPSGVYEKDFKSIKKIGRLDIYINLRLIRVYYLYLMKDFNAKKSIEQLTSESRTY